MHVRQNQTMNNWALNLPTSLSSNSLAVCKKTTDNLLLRCIWQMPAPIKKMNHGGQYHVSLYECFAETYGESFFCTVYDF